MVWSRITTSTAASGATELTVDAIVKAAEALPKPFTRDPIVLGRSAFERMKEHLPDGPSGEKVWLGGVDIYVTDDGEELKEKMRLASELMFRELREMKVR